MLIKNGVSYVPLPKSHVQTTYPRPRARSAREPGSMPRHYPTVWSLQKEASLGEARVGVVSDARPECHIFYSLPVYLTFIYPHPAKQPPSGLRPPPPRGRLSKSPSDKNEAVTLFSAHPSSSRGSTTYLSGMTRLIWVLKLIRNACGSGFISSRQKYSRQKYSRQNIVTPAKAGVQTGSPSRD